MATRRRRQTRAGDTETRCFRKVRRRIVDPFAPVTSRATWKENESASELMRYAAPLLARQHLALVLAAIVGRAWRHWNAVRPDDWSFAWTVALLRAWAFGEVAGEELRRPLMVDHGGQLWPAFVNQMGRPYRAYDDTNLSTDAFASAAAAVAVAVEAVTAEHVEQAAEHVVSAVRFAEARAAEMVGGAEFMRWELELQDLSALEAADPARHAGQEHTAEWYRAAREVNRSIERARSAWWKASRKSNADSVATIRALVPYVSRRTSDWTVTGPLVVTGDVLLRCDGWEVVDAVRVEELLRLDGQRSVAFDLAMERHGVVHLRDAR